MAFRDLHVIQELFDEFSWRRDELEIALSVAYKRVLAQNAAWLANALRDPIYRERRAEQVRAANRRAHAKKKLDPERWARRLKQMNEARKRYESGRRKQ